MKKFWGSLLGLSVTVTALQLLVSSPVMAASGIKIDETNFPDDNFRRVISGPEYDANGNGYLSDSEIKKVINIRCEGEGIKSLKGVEYFTALQGLWCKDNKIKTVDLSKNKDLRGVWCSGNLFTSLDFSSNPELVWVYCHDCKLTKLNITKNSKLAYLECNTNTDLKSLNVSNNPELEHLMCGTCGITSLNLSNNPNLSHLDAFRNKLTSIDLSNNPKLKRLDIWDNNDLGNVDISGLPELQYYNCANNGVSKLNVSNNPELQKLICSYNKKIKTLDLSNNPKLAYLDCADNVISKLDLSNNHQLYFLQAFTNEFTELDIGDNSRLLKTYKDGYKQAEYNVGVCHSWSIEYGGWTELAVEHLYFFCVDDDVKVKTTPSGAPDSPDSYIDTNDGLSSSDDLITREMAIQTLYELAGSPSVKGLTTRFTDVEKDSWYEKAVKWGEANKIAYGYPNVCSDTFGVGEYITRQDMALMLHRYAAYEKYSTGFDYGRTDWYKDYFDIDYYAWGAFTWTIQWEMISPKGPATDDLSQLNLYPHGRFTRDEFKTAITTLLKMNYEKVPSVIPIPSAEVYDLVKVDAKAATCTKPGNKAYWYSESSGKYYGDVLAKTQIAKDSWVIAALGHSVTKTNAKAETCTSDGNIECWTCTRCGSHFEDQAATKIVKDEDFIIKSPWHSLLVFEAKDADCYEDGRKGYCECTRCGKYFSDLTATTEIKKDSWVIPAAHSYDVVTTPATLTEDGSIVSTCRVCQEVTRAVIHHPDTVKLSTTSYTYNGNARKPSVKVTDSAGNAVSSKYFTVVFKNSSGSVVTEAKKVGKYFVEVTFTDRYSGVVDDLSFTIKKGTNPLKIKTGKTAKVRYSSLRKKNQTLSVSKVISFSNKGQGKLTYTKSSGTAKIKINKTTGKVTVKKGLKKGTYKIKVKVKAAGNSNYNSKTKSVTFKIKVN